MVYIFVIQIGADKMIKNIIFDFGQVLVHFEPRYMTEQYIENEDDVILAEKVIFDRFYWDRLDDGTISDDEVVSLVKTRLPKRLHLQAEKVYRNWIYNLPEVSGMRELIDELKDKYGVSLFLLSNISTYFSEHSGEIPILDKFDGLVFSAVCGFSKPNRDIFAHICEKFDLKSEETLFVDDSEKNIAGASEFGIKSFLFKKDVDKLRVWLEEELKK